MENLIRNLKFAESLIKEDKKISLTQTDIFDPIYPFSNENTKDCFAPFNLSNKKVLTVLSSSDQLFEMFLNGAREFDTFDINPLTKEYFYLKLSALMSKISKEEYLEFFCHMQYISSLENNHNSFNKETFEKIKLVLSSNYTKFWDELFSSYTPLDIRRPNRLFNDDEPNRRVLEKTLSYLESKNFQYIQNHIDELLFNFIESDIRNISSKLTSQYDLIYLSNIIKYAKSLFPTNPLEEFKNIILELSNYLNPNGKIIAGYIYEIETQNEIPINNKKYRDKVFFEEEFSYHYFKKIYDIKWNNPLKEHDGCLIYTKKWQKAYFVV